ncbi:MAG: leucine-rich repeat protein, partial [Candidatus Cloacimonetes bacterium]|nr:leucine-rich repeat protein [Candidatus Cloacimonadota bacterium]
MADYDTSTPGWHPYRDTIKSVNIGSGVTSIGYQAFSFCTSLKNVTIGNGVTTIGYRAFSGCTNLTSVTFGTSVTTIGELAFDSCTNLTSVVIPDSVTSMGDRVFEECTSLETVTIGNGVTTIGDQAFVRCTNLTSVVIPDSVTSMGDRPFEGCTSLKNVTIGNGVTTIGDYAFLGCNSLETVTIGNGITTIGDKVFAVSTSLKNVTIIGNGLTTIGDYAFQLCTSLETVTIGNGVTTIGYQAFSGCTSLKNVTIIGNGVTTIGYQAFVRCTSLKTVTIGNGVTTIGYQAFVRCTNLTSVVIPDSVTSMGDRPFEGCTSLKTVTIGNGLTTIGKYTFFGCSNLETVTIGNGLTTIEDAAFMGFTSLKTVTIGNGLTTIGNIAFYGCSNLEVVDLTNTTSLSSVGTQAFGSKSSNAIKSGSVIYVSDERTAALFIDGRNYYAPNTTVVVKGTVQEITYIIKYDANGGTGTMADQTFTYNTTQTLSSNTFVKDARVFSGWAATADGPVVYTDNQSVRNLLDTDGAALTLYAVWTPVTAATYSGTCGENLTWTLTTETGVLEITGSGKMADYYTSTPGWYPYRDNITSISLSSGVTSIGEVAFSGCKSLTTIEIPDSVKSIGYAAFIDCKSLTSVTIGNSVTSIGEWAFTACTNLTSIEIPDGVTSIGEGAFYGCSDLEVVDLSDTTALSSVGNDAFGNNSNSAMKSDSVIYVSDENAAALFIDGTNYYAPNTTIVVKETTPIVPKFTIETSSQKEILKGDNITISGIAEGTDRLLYYVLAPHYSRGGYLSVENGTYAANFSTANLTVGSPCFVIIQHPMDDYFFNIIPIRDYTKNCTFVYQNNTAQPTGGPGDIFLFNMTNTTGIYAFEKICQGIDDPANDDRELNLTFTIRKGDPAAGSLVYIYQNGALKPNTTYYRWVDGNQEGSVTTNFNGTLIGEGIAEGLYSSNSTSPADLFTLKYPMINLSAYLNNTSIPISGRNIPKNQTIDFKVSGDNGLYYTLKFVSPDGSSTFTFGDTTFDSYNITKNPEIQNNVSLTNASPGIWKVFALFSDSPDSYNSLNRYTPSSYKISEVIRFNVGTAGPGIFTAVPESVEVSKGNEIVITGTAENTGGSLRYYVFSDHYTIIKRIPVNNDGSYKVNISTVNLSSGSCFVIIQHPMYDGRFNIGPVHNILTDNFLYIYQNNTAQPTGEDGDIFLVNISNTSGFPAFEIVRQGIDDPAND